jgi:hypothetical protein
LLLQIPAELSPFSFYNAAINSLTYDRPNPEADSKSARIKILGINETDHLKAAGLMGENHKGDL